MNNVLKKSNRDILVIDLNNFHFISLFYLQYIFISQSKQLLNKPWKLLFLLLLYSNSFDSFSLPETAIVNSAFEIFWQQWRVKKKGTLQEKNESKYIFSYSFFQNVTSIKFKKYENTSRWHWTQSYILRSNIMAETWSSMWLHCR